MDDAVYTFKEDVKERKSMVSGARHKKNGSKSKSCKLPYENLSYYQRKKLNGEVKSYPMNRPMTWSEFKTYPDDLQETYLATLVDAFNVTMVQIGNMMGVTNTALNRLIKSKNFQKIRRVPNKRVLTDSDIKGWNDFLGDWPIGQYDTKPSESKHKLDTKPSESKDKLEPVTSSNDSDASTTVSGYTSISQFSIVYDGDVKLLQVVDYLRSMLGEDFNGHLEISFCK